MIGSVKSDLLNIFNNYDIKCSKLVTNSRSTNEFLAFCHSDIDADKIFDVDCARTMSSIGCSAIMPVKLKANRSILLKNLDEYIYSRDVDEIKIEIDRCNQSMSTIDIFKFPNSKIIKLTFSNTEMAERCLKNGLKLFLLHISPSEIQREEFIDVKVCYRCFDLNSHLKSECPKPPDYIICSKCATIGHDFKMCTSTGKKCVNCSQSHQTLSLSCQKRKDIVKNIRDQNRVSSNRSYATVSKSPVETPKVDLIQLNDSITKSVMCLLIASGKEKETNGSFKSTLNYLQKLNGVPAFELGNITLPRTFVDFYNANGVLNNEDFSSTQQEPAESVNTSPESNPSTSASTESNPSTSASTELNPSTSASSELNPSTSSSSELNSSTSLNVTTNVPRQRNIIITKKKSCPSIDSNNFEKIYRQGYFVFECTDGMNVQDCLAYLKGNLLELKTVITKAKIKDGRVKNK